MSQKDTLLDGFENSIKNVTKLDNITSLFINSLKSIYDSGEQSNAPRTLLNAIQNQIDQYKGISATTEEIFPTVYQQQLILLVSILENYLEKIFVLVCKTNHTKINPQEFKHLSFKIEDFLKYSGSRERIGELLIEKDNKINFQNLTSIVENFQKIGIRIEPILANNEKTRIKLLLQYRHLLVHKNGIVDQEFLSSSEDKQQVGSKISITTEEVKDFIKISTKLIKAIITEI